MNITHDPKFQMMNQEIIELSSRINQIEKEKVLIRSQTEERIFSALSTTLGDLSKTRSEQILSFNIVLETKKRI